MKSQKNKTKIVRVIKKTTAKKNKTWKKKNKKWNNLEHLFSLDSLTTFLSPPSPTLQEMMNQKKGKAMDFNIMKFLVSSILANNESPKIKSRAHWTHLNYLPLNRTFIRELQPSMSHKWRRIAMVKIKEKRSLNQCNWIRWAKILTKWKIVFAIWFKISILCMSVLFNHQKIIVTVGVF